MGVIPGRKVGDSLASLSVVVGEDIMRAVGVCDGRTSTARRSVHAMWPYRYQTRARYSQLSLTSAAQKESAPYVPVVPLAAIASQVAAPPSWPRSEHA